MTVALGGRHYYCQDSCYPDEGVRQWLGWWPKVMKLINGIWTLSIKFQILVNHLGVHTTVECIHQQWDALFKTYVLGIAVRFIKEIQKHIVLYDLLLGEWFSF